MYTVSKSDNMTDAAFDRDLRSMVKARPTGVSEMPPGRLAKLKQVRAEESQTLEARLRSEELQKQVCQGEGSGYISNFQWGGSSGVYPGMPGDW